MLHEESSNLNAKNGNSNPQKNNLQVETTMPTNVDDINKEIDKLQRETTDEALEKVKRVEDLKIQKYILAKQAFDKSQSAFVRLDLARKGSAKSILDIELILRDANGNEMERVVIKGGIDKAEINNLTDNIYSSTGLLNNAVSRLKEHDLNIEHQEALRIIETRKILQK